MNGDIWIAIGACAFVVVAFLASLLVPRRSLPSRATSTKLDELKARVDQVEKVANNAAHDVKNIRMSVGALATKDAVGRVEVQVAEMRGEMKGVAKSSEATTRSIERIEDFLMRATAENIGHPRSAETPS